MKNLHPATPQLVQYADYPEGHSATHQNETKHKFGPDAPFQTEHVTKSIRFLQNLRFLKMTKLYTLEREQTVATDISQAWAFISRPENLNRITPEDMHFSIQSTVPEKMYNGLLIEYRIRLPLLGQQTWLTEIKHIREGQSFVDEQRIGPYALWYHYHEITETTDGIRFTDRVNYALPAGPLGRILHSLYIRQELERIFHYRKQALTDCLT